MPEIKERIREQFLALGADACGFAAIERFDGSPQGYHPRDLYARCEAVVSFGVALPKGLLDVTPDFLYGRFNAMLSDRADAISLSGAKYIETAFNARAVPVPSDGPVAYWDADRREARGMISMKHAAMLAGIGSIGKNTLLVSRRFGNRLILGAVLTDLKLTSDDPAPDLCREKCGACVAVCPAHAIDAGHVAQKACREVAYPGEVRGFGVTACNRCRRACPLRYGE